MKSVNGQVVILTPRRLLQFFLLLFLSLSFQQGEAAKPTSIHFGVLSIAQPSRIYAKWQPFVNYMSAQLGRPVELVLPRGFGRMKQDIESGKVDFFYINSYIYYLLFHAGKAVAVAQIENIEGKTTSQSEIFVRKNSGIHSIDDLKGKLIAFVSPLGAGGYMAPRAYLYASGLKDNQDFKQVFTRNLSNSIHGVLLGDYAAATMCGVNFKLMSQKIKTGDLRIIATSNKYPENIIAARTHFSPALISQFHQQLLAMNKTIKGKKILNGMRSMKIKSFVNYNSESMDKMIKKLITAGHL